MGCVCVLFGVYVLNCAMPSNERPNTYISTLPHDSAHRQIAAAAADDDDVHEQTARNTTPSARVCAYLKRCRVGVSQAVARVRLALTGASAHLIISDVHQYMLTCSVRLRAVIGADVDDAPVSGYARTPTFSSRKPPG